MKHKQTIKIRLYEKWVDDSSGKVRSFKTVGHPRKIWTGKVLTLIRKIAQVSFVRCGKEQKWLVLLTFGDYENALVGNSEQIKRFVKDCLNDLKGWQ